MATLRVFKLLIFFVGGVDPGGETYQRGASLPDPLEGLHGGK